jgi:hypothetical protein
MDASIVSVKLMNRTLKDLKAFYIIRHDIKPGSAKRNYRSWRNCVSGALFLKNPLLAGYFTNILFPLTKNLFIFG